MEVIVNMGDAVEFSNVPTGAYEVVCEKAPEISSSKAGNPCLDFEFTIVGSNDQEQYKGQKLWRKTPLNGKGAGISEQTMKALQMPFVKLGEGDKADLQFDTDHAVGCRAIAHVESKMVDSTKTPGTLVPVCNIVKMTPIME